MKLFVALFASSLIAIVSPQCRGASDTGGHYKLTEIDFPVSSISDGSFSYSSKGPQSGFSTKHNVTPVKGASGPFNWTTNTSWSIPEIIVPGKPCRFELSGNSSRDQYSAILGISLGSKASWPLAAVRRGLTAKFGGEAVRDVSSCEFTLTIPKEIADWRDKSKWKLAANIRTPGSELYSVYQSSGSARVTTKTPSEIPTVENKLTVKDWMYGEGALNKLTVDIACGSILNHDAVARYTYKWQDSGTKDTPAKKVEPKPAASPTLSISPDRFDCLLGSKRSAQIKASVQNGGSGSWKIRAEYEKNARRFATVSVKQTGNTSAVIDLKEAGLKPEPGDDNLDYATLLVTAEQKGQPALQAKLTICLIQEGVFISDINRNRENGQFKVFADGKNKPTELDFRVFAIDAKTQKVANLTKNATSLKKVAVECLEKNTSPAARLLASGGFLAVPASIRPMNEPAGTLKMSFARELPGDGSIVPCRFRLHYTDRKEATFSAPFTIGIVTTANGPGGKNWNEELERCETIIKKFVPLSYRARMQAMLDKRKKTLGAEGLAHLRKKIWSAAAQLTLAEGGKGYENEAAWANTITESLEWTKWAGDFAFDVSVGIYMGPYGSTSAGILKDVIQSAIEAYQEGKSAKEWAWEYLCTIPELVEGKVIDVDAFEKWGVKSKAKAWAIYVGYHFLKNLTAGEGIVAALKETAKTVGENVLTGWLGDQIEANKDRRVSDLVRKKK